jgi:hypothetical protein
VRRSHAAPRMRRPARMRSVAPRGAALRLRPVRPRPAGCTGRDRADRAGPAMESGPDALPVPRRSPRGALEEAGPGARSPWRVSPRAERDVRERSLPFPTPVRRFHSGPPREYGNGRGEPAPWAAFRSRGNASDVPHRAGSLTRCATVDASRVSVALASPRATRVVTEVTAGDSRSWARRLISARNANSCLTLGEHHGIRTSRRWHEPRASVRWVGADARARHADTRERSRRAFVRVRGREGGANTRGMK